MIGAPPTMNASPVARTALQRSFGPRYARIVAAIKQMASPITTSFHVPSGSIFWSGGA